MIIGIAGTLGAGKGTVVEYLVEEKGFKHYSASGFITEEIITRGMPVNRDSMSIVANDLRATYGSGYLMEQLITQAVMGGGDAIVESLHSTGEAEAVRRAGGVVIAVDADIRIRYDRIQQRKSAKDNVTFEKFLSDNEREIASTDPKKHNIAENIRKADYKIMNNGSLDELHAQIDKMLEQIKK